MYVFYKIRANLVLKNTKISTKVVLSICRYVGNTSESSSILLGQSMFMKDSLRQSEMWVESFLRCQRVAALALGSPGKAGGSAG